MPVTRLLQHARLTAAIVGLAIALSACGSATEAAPSGRGGRGGQGGGRGGPGGKPAEPLPVEVTTLTRANLERTYEVSGTLRSLRHAEIRPQQGGVLRELFAEEGDRVEEGQLLADVDTRTLSLSAKRDALEARNAELELDRLESIAEKGAVAREEIDKQRYAAQSAKASAKLSRFQASLGDVRAPFAGTITKRHVDVGNLVMTSTAVFDLDDVSALELDLYLPEREAAAVAVDAPVTLTLLDGTAVAARVVRRAPVVDAATGTVKITVRVGGSATGAEAEATAGEPDAKATPEPNSLPLGAIPGAFVRANVLVERRVDAPSLPKTAVFEHEGQPHVYLVDGKKTRRTKVRVGMSSTDRVEILEGLASDATVVADATGGIVEGMPITPVGADGAVKASPAGGPGEQRAPNAEGGDRAKGRERGEKPANANANGAGRGG